MKKVISLIGAVIALSAGTMTALKYQDNQLLESVLSETYYFEYGEDVELLHEDFELRYDTSSFENEDGYIKVGDHTVKVYFDFKSKEIEKDVKITVKDNLGPTFTEFKDEFEVYENEEIKDLNKKFKAEDLTKVKINFDLEKVNFEKKGSYKGKAIAKDTHGNSTIKVFSVHVKEKPKPKPVPKPQTDPDSQQPSSPSTYPVTKEATYRGGHVIVNKKHGIPPNYASGENPEAVGRLRDLISEMQSNGMRVDGSWAGYRTYEHQEILYTRYIREHGQAAADTFSAVPGFSEHQTGLAFDLRSPSGVLLQTEPEITWVKENAHRFGFIVRYPEGKTHITGYIHEPWHLRYLGSDAIKLYEANQTMEEYFNIEG